MMELELEDLKESNEFLNLLLDNINTAVLIADENLQIHQFNNSFLNLFDKAAEGALAQGFGEVSGCVNAILENKSCGETSHCADCVLRRSLIHNLVDSAQVDRQPLDRIFYINGKPIQKHLQFSTRRITFQGREMFLVIIQDVTEIEDQKIELQTKQKLLEMDLKAAAAIQQSLLPNGSPNVDNIRIAWKFEPCEQIGGDIFNIHSVDERSVAFYMLDVCGHGVQAALISVAASQFLNSKDGLYGNNRELLSPEAVLNKLDQAFPFERFNSFFSIIGMTIDVTEGLLTYSCAGHPAPILLHPNGAMEILDHRGPIIGSGLGQSYDQETMTLQAGDKIILYTDGLIENRNSEDEDYGKKRFYDVLKKTGNLPVPKIVDTVYSEIIHFYRGVKPDDDISIMGVEYTGNGGTHFSI
jgi:sigma-B regulation protein RsbU (phosphoserine phosphatase)